METVYLVGCIFVNVGKQIEDFLNDWWIWKSKYLNMDVDIYTTWRKSCSHVRTIVWLLPLDFNETLEGKTKFEPHKEFTWCFEQIQEKKQLYGHLPTISQPIQVRHTRYAGHCWRRKNVFSSDVFLCTPTHRHTSFGWPAKNYIHQFCVDTKWYIYIYIYIYRERERERILVVRMPRWLRWWWFMPWSHDRF